MGGKQSSASRSRAPFPGVSSDDTVVPPTSHFVHYRSGNPMGLRSRSVSSVSGLDPPAPGLPFGLYRTGPETERGGSSGGAEEPRGGLYLGSRASLADTLQIAPRWIGAHSGFRCPICSKSVASDEMEMHFIMCLSKPRLSYNDDVLTRDAGECVICLEELSQGDTIARLPCLCIYHKR
ncbi:hypothetical protein GDO86_008135 [Hymenochirus boettgeri]|uniref:RING-type E3 ubiquitin transferase n=1 Tax=Hymenochirus boettgeri TaxID=247094 RepID=A0A8T2J0B6_9PIPI|nr:hypothetical protein GDO86_008135 [Hymenochirus boettgeri]